MTEENFITVSLRPYQEKALADVRMNLAKGDKRVLVYAPTGAGKSELAVAVAQMARGKGNRVVFLVHRKDLVRQQVERFEKYGMAVGILQGQNTHRPHSNITVGSIQTLSSRKRFGWHFDFDVLIVDEAHLCAGSKQYQELFRSWSNLPIIGLSATPFSKGLGKLHQWGRLFESMVVVSTIRALVKDGFLVDCEIYAPSEPDLSKVRTLAGDYHEGDLAEAVDKPKLIGDIVTHWLRLASGKQTICFGTNIVHSKHIVQQFLNAGISAVHVDCYMPEEDRLDAVAKFRAGEVTILSNVALFAEGFDAPETSCMILARPTKSLIRYIQMAGRILRPAEGKDIALILDHSGTVRRLGFPTDDLPLELDDGKARKSLGSVQKERLPSVCSSCGYVDSRRQHKCPMCGFAPEKKAGVAVAQGELKKIQRKFSTNEKQEIYSALVGKYEAEMAAGKSWKYGWPDAKYKTIVGKWPKGLARTPGPMTKMVDDWLVHERIRYIKQKKQGCPKCASDSFERYPGAGPHQAGARCNDCGTFWWLSKAA